MGVYGNMRLRVESEEYFIDGKPLLSPEQCVEISENDLDDADTARDESGIMHRIVVRECVKTWTFSYALLSYEDYLYIKELFAGKPEFAFSYRDLDGSQKTCRAYCSKRSVTQFNKATGLYKNLKFNIIEC